MQVFNMPGMDAWLQGIAYCVRRASTLMTWSLASSSKQQILLCLSSISPGTCTAVKSDVEALAD